MKKCFKCGKEKMPEDFYKHPQMGDGRLGKCKECTRKDVHDNYLKRREYYALYEEKRARCPARKTKALHYQQKRRKEHRDIYIANAAVCINKRKGRLISQDCYVCGCKKTEAHHPDYSKPLDIQWLCRKHHLEVHGKEAYLFQVAI